MKIKRKTIKTSLLLIGMCFAASLAWATIGQDGPPETANFDYQPIASTGAGPSWGVMGVLLYFLPSLLALFRKRFKKVLPVNLLLGWTIIGWIVAFVWAASVQVEEPPKA